VRVAAHYVDDTTLRIEISDDGRGGADGCGTGLQGLADRVAALDGRFEIDSPIGGGTRISAVLPCA
jgi:signal transduction histidine kinase